jgi:hypothetical protein
MEEFIDLERRINAAVDKLANKNYENLSKEALDLLSGEDNIANVALQKFYVRGLANALISLCVSRGLDADDVKPMLDHYFKYVIEECRNKARAIPGRH